MTPAVRRVTCGFACCVLFITSHALLVSSSVFSGSVSACEGMARWASQYEGRSMPLTELATFDRAHRRAIFAKLAPESRAALMQSQLRAFRLRADLTQEQRALITEGIAIATPALYRREPAASDALKAFWARAGSSFTSREHLRAWGDVGGMVPAPKGRVVSLFERLTSPYRALAQAPDCDCHPAFSGLDCGGATCGGGMCNFVANACGAFSWFNCVGLCQ